jgi:hypothetical protein
MKICRLSMRANRRLDHVLAWLTTPGRRVREIGGLALSHCINGNALAACCRLGLAADPRSASSPNP